MRATIRTIITGTALIAGSIGLSACHKSGAPDESNVVEMNANDGSMNDMTTVDSATLDAAGSANAAGSNVAMDNGSNAT